ncbi:hypothetical protein SFRURICE_020496 [Spodoptera frugiperda]|nr:hypothetical protein SFRURICE_020496 [Spodoptera frugiperda]
MQAAFNGHLKEIPFIRIDNFTSERDHVSAYFLSHFHGDHISGLNHWGLGKRGSKIYIYTSEVTVAIIKVRHPELEPHLKSLALGRNALSIQTKDAEEFLGVTMLPAGHSLGSVMFLFEYKNQNILFTGDFRISKNDVAKYKHLQNNGEPIKIDVLYVDTTFQDRPSFPKRSEVVSDLIPHIKHWLADNPKNVVLLSVSAMFGYEGACNQIYDEIKIKANVNEDDWKIFRTRRSSHLPQVPLHNILTLDFSALHWTSPNLEEEFLTKESDNKISVCYSTHCGRDELMHFINYLNPTIKKGFPKDFKENNSKLTFYSIFTNRDGDAKENYEISPKKKKIVRKNDDNRKSSGGKRKLAETYNMQNDAGEFVDLYCPRKCSASNRLIHAKDHASVQLVIADVDPATGRAADTSKMYVVCGAIRRMGESDDCIVRLTKKDGILAKNY